MATSLNISVYIPSQVLRELTCTYLFGYYRRTDSSTIINCTIGIDDNEVLQNLFKNLTEDVWESSSENSIAFSFFGVLHSSKKRTNFQSSIADNSKFPILFSIRLDSVHKSFHLESLCIDKTAHKNINYLILYDSWDLIRSRLIYYNKAYLISSNPQKNCLAFLYDSFESNLKHSKVLSSVTSNKSINFIQWEENFISKHCLHFTINIIALLTVVLNYGKTLSLMPLWFYQCVLKVLLLTRAGCQLHQRFLHIKQIIVELNSRNSLSLKCKNLMYIILIDLICGWIISASLLQSNVPLLLLDYSLEKTNYLVNGLKGLIFWLMGVPAGLKLNVPLNSTLGHFFLYHIYLWEAYMTVVLPVFTFIMNVSTVIGFIGATFILCLVSDLMSLATIHIYCFYGYATRLYGYQMASLSALWRLFRGKKWNPLRQRVDSFTYDTHQLFLGTLIFTVLLFLLPTVMVYYFVFASLRIMVLAIQGLLSKLINIITVCPVYSVVSRMLWSSETTGDVCFTVFNADAILVLSMKTSQVSLMNVIQVTLPELNKYEEYLTWKDFLSSIVWGKLIYPL